MTDPSIPPRVSSRLSSSARISNSISRRVHREVRFGDYVLGSTLGQGEFGKVKLGWRKDGKQPEQVAIKLIRKDTVPPKSSRETKVFREINALKLLTHPNIVRLEEVIQNDKYIGIVLEYASGGELFDHILTHRYLKDNMACRLFSQLISGVHYLHSKGIVHRDLKLENLLLDKHKNIIITDFGFANSFKAAADGSIHDLMSTSCGSPCYAAPELVVSDAKYVGRKVDVWSCGVILYAMLAGYLPFDDDPANPDGDNITQLYKYITTTPLTFPEYIQPMPRDLLRKILVPDPIRRIELNAVRSHAWLAPHAHFLSVTPLEWDRSFLRQPLQPPQLPTQSQQTPPSPPPKGQQLLSESHKRHSSYQPAQSAFTTPPTQIIPPSPATPASDYNNQNNGVTAAAQYRQPNQTYSNVNSTTQLGRSSSQRSTSTSAGASRSNTPSARPQSMVTPLPRADYGNQSRRHSVQAGYTKGLPSTSNKDASNSSDDAEEPQNSLYASPSLSSSKNAITPIDETSDDLILEPSDDTDIDLSNSLSKVAVSKHANTARLPQAHRKPRPTSMQPSYAYSSSSSFSYDASFAKPAPTIPGKPLNFPVPMSEPRVGITQDTTLPGEISRPSAFKTNTTPRLAAIDTEEQSGRNRVASPDTATTATPTTTATAAVEGSTPTSSPIPKQKASPAPSSADRTGRYSEDQGSNPHLSDANSVASSNKYPTYPRRAHKRNANSISYNLGRLVGSKDSKDLVAPSGPATAPRESTTSRHRHTQSMAPGVVMGDPNASITSKHSTPEKKRFSFLGFYGTNSSSHSGISSSSTNNNRNSISIDAPFGRGQEIVVPPNPNAGSGTIATQSAERKSSRHSRNASVPYYTSNTASSGGGGAAANASQHTKSPQSKEPSATRRFVDFFRRRKAVS